MKTDCRIPDSVFKTWLVMGCVLAVIFAFLLTAEHLFLITVLPAQLTVTQEAQQQLDSATVMETLEKDATKREFKLAVARRLMKEKKAAQDQIAAINQRIADIDRQLAVLNQ